ncbi:sensor histidine kinase [Eisenbergiella tayi]|uniref:sensor histidine kinase n=1 Tax=Eisenbergiella tayi TaxID=1432052 RepID=UPI0008483AB8|nr:histidine kinase [Eisenbergiella tayi]ODR28299.1 hypothetical protein BEI60_31205 [Eisenbergiella tayi]
MVNYDNTDRGMEKGLNRKKSIRTRLLLIFGFFMTISLLFSVILYFLATYTVKRTMFDKMDTQANFYLETIDNHFKNTENLFYNMFSDRKLIFLVNRNNLLDAYELRDAYLSEQERIMLLKESNPLISSVVIYLPNMEMKISDFAITVMEETDFEVIKQKYVSSDENVHYKDGSLFMSSSGTPIYEAGELPDVLFVVEFGESKIKETLRNLNTIENGGSFFYNEEQNIFIDSGEMNGTGSKILEQLKPLFDKGSSFSDTLRIEGEKYQISVSVSDYLGYYVQYAPEKEILKNMEGYKWLILLYIVGFAGLAAVTSKGIEKTVHKPLNKLMEAFSKVEKENISTGGTEYTGDDEFAYLFDGFNQMQDRTKMLVDELIEQKELAQQAELKQLQAQINPHFLYNSFFSLRNKIRREELDSAEKLSSLLGTYFRFLTRNDDGNVPLKNEIEHARSYTEIQHMRFRDRIQVQFEELPEDCREILVPRLILQPVIENALNYGLEEKEEDGLLCVSFQKKEDILEIHIEDNGDFFTDEKLQQLRRQLIENKEITGLINIHKRLLLYWGEKSGIVIERSTLGGAEIILKILCSNNR